MRNLLAATLAAALPIYSQQQTSIAPFKPAAPAVLRPYLPQEVPAIRTANSPRLATLIKAGTLYLTLPDAIALALENNIDLELARYSPITAAYNLERAQAGGALPGVPSGASTANTVTNGQGVAGSQAAAGVSNNGSNSGSGNAGNATISQIGPVTQNLDPAIQDSTAFSHRTNPQPNLQQSNTPVLVTNTRIYSTSIQQGSLLGGNIALTYRNSYLNENAPTDILNPSVAPSLAFTFQHNLLRGFGFAVNSRNITVSKINLATSDLNFRTQVTNVVASVVSAYNALVADYESIKSVETAQTVAQAFFEDNKRRLDAGSLAQLDVISSETQFATSQQNVVNSQSGLKQDELRMKNLISRAGTADPQLRAARIVPLDKLTIPATDDVLPLPELLARALTNRSDLAAEKARITTAQVSALGTQNGVLPSLQISGALSQAGLAGTRNAGRPDPYFVGGMGDALGQVFRHNFPTERIGAFASISLGNNQARADQAIDQLQLRQTQLSVQKDINQLQVDILNSLTALQQARARYDAAVKNRVLQDELFKAEQTKFTLGASTPYNVTQQQRDLVASRNTETSALVSYNNARIALDQAAGTVLESNHIDIASVR